MIWQRFGRLGSHSQNEMEGGEKKNWIPPKKKWKCSASWWALRSQASSVFKTEVWLPPAARHKNNSLHIHKQEINGQISCVLSTLYRILIQKQPFHYRRNRHRFFTTGGQSYWFCKRKVDVWCRFPVCVVDCMQTRGSICFLLIGVWRSSAHQDSHFYRLARAHTHAHTRTHTVIKQNRAMCLQLPGGRRCSDSLQANCDLVESCDWCSGAKLEKANWATNTTDPVGTL